MRRLLCITGKRFSGKDTFAAQLLERARARGIALATYAFAAESKRLFVAAQRARGVDVELGRLQSDRAYKEQWRRQLTEFTEEALTADPLVFVRAVTQRIAEDTRPPIVTDLRLQKELGWLRPRFELQVVRLTRADQQRAACGWRFEAAKDLHFTETELDDPALWTQVVRNDGTLDELAAQAERVLSAYLP